MEMSKSFYAADRKAWRAWLSRNHKKEKDVWLIYYKKSSGKKRIPYNDAVEEALCFGWIDSIVKRVDGEKFAQRFSPRRPTSGLSQANRERIREMISEGKMTREGLAAVSHAFDAGKKDEFTVSSSITNAIRKDKDAWKNFQKMPEKYKRVRISYLESRKRHGMGEFRKSLRHFIKMTAKNKRFGFVR